MQQLVRQILAESARVLGELAEQGSAAVAAAAQLIARCLEAGGKVLIFGNGGSAADAQHFAAELVNRFQMERAALAAVALTTDTSVLTSIGNDRSFGLVFARQVEALGRAGDVAVGISTSGRSENVLNGLRAAKEKGLGTIGLAGNQPQEMKGLCDVLVMVPSGLTPRIQEGHIAVIHAICELVERQLFGRE